MATNKTDKVLNVPTLRFPGFTGEWQILTLGKICDTFEYGMNVPAKEYDGENRYIRITDIDDCSHLYSLLNEVSPDGNLEDKYLVKEGDILFARTGASVGKSYIYRSSDGKLYFAGFLIRAHVRCEYNPFFVFYQTLTSKYSKWVNIMSARSGQPGINSQEYASYQLSVPPMNEQKKLADFLSLLDERIALQSKLIDRLKSLMDGIRKRLFQKSTSHQLLGNIVDIRKGKQINGSELLEEGKYPVMNGGISPSGFLNEYNTPAGTISISEGGNSCGYVQFNDTPIWSGGHCYTLHLICGDIDYRYLYHFLKHSESEIMKLRIGSGLPNIQKKDLSKFPITSYPISNQMKISKTLDVMEARILNEEFMLQSYAKLKAYLLSAMFI